MRVLFVHREFPGQFGTLAQTLAADPAHQVVFATAAKPDDDLRLKIVNFSPRRQAAPTTHHYLRNFESEVLMGQATFEACARLRRDGFVPDVIYAHCGWGVTLYLKEAFPEARLIGYFEWFYRTHDSDTDFLEPDRVDLDRACRIRTLNASILMALADCDLGICPTEFQKSQFPRDFAHKLVALHDGIDTDYFAPDATIKHDKAAYRFGAVDLGQAPRLVTYATRGMEPYRGFPQFMRAADLLLKADPAVQIAIAGSDEVFYSRKLPDGASYKNFLLQELPDLDLSRLHFLGPLRRDDYRRLLQLSDAHVYLTVPFVLSWSLLEAMSCGCLIIGSDTAPVREVISAGETGLSVDFHSSVQLAETMHAVIADRDRYIDMRSAARSQVLRQYRATDLIPRQLQLLLQGT
jgi:glycosyltransferase involved in cell wall biosynthesis